MEHFIWRIKYHKVFCEVVAEFVTILINDHRENEFISKVWTVLKSIQSISRADLLRWMKSGLTSSRLKENRSCIKWWQSRISGSAPQKKQSQLHLSEMTSLIFYGIQNWRIVRTS